MKLSIKPPRQFINPLLSKKPINKEAFESFKQKLIKYHDDIKQEHHTKQSEPNIVASALKPFLESCGYFAKPFSQKGQSGIDLALMHSNNTPAVIVEAKKHNELDMLTEQNPNAKALQEAALYYMRERKAGNTNIYHVVVTDFFNWYIFDASEFERVFWKGSTFQKIFQTYTDPKQLLNTTKEIYPAFERAINELKRDLIEEEEISCTSFHLEKNLNEKDLIAIYKLLSPDSLLKQFNPNDANALNRGFYNELLYILGLEESKKGGKKIIGRASSPQVGSLYENIRLKLEQYGKPHEFDDVIRLIIIWLNRILFLKLLESQIVLWTGEKAHKFLHVDKINQFDELEILFFEVLAKPISSRSNHNYDYIPYLNSSLFEIHADEKTGMTIANLNDRLTIPYYKATVVKDEKTHRKVGEVSALQYLFEFLDAYDFGNDSSEEIVSEHRPLINPSVLGLIFEKINGYKDGSFYTPSFITMYMVKETLRRSVVEKLNDAFEQEELKFNNFDELKNYADRNAHKENFRVIPPKRAASKSRINTSPAFSAGRVSLLKPSYAFALE